MKAKKTDILKDYSPSINEEYMNAKQIAYFKGVLEVWRLQAHHNLSEVEKRLAELNASEEHDDMDRAFIETEVAITINKISSLQNLLNEIDISLHDIDAGTYGYCKKSGKEIGLKRLLAKPTSRFGVKAQETEEKENNVRFLKDEDEDEENVNTETEEHDELRG